MLNAVTVTLDTNTLKDKLFNYFSNSCPIEVFFDISASGVTVTDILGKSVVIPFMPLAVNDYIEEIIKVCEKELYLKVKRSSYQKRSYSIEEMKSLILRGRRLEDLNKGHTIEVCEEFILYKISLSKNTILLKSDLHIIKAVLYKPVKFVLNELRQLSERERYLYITKNAKIGEIDAVR